MRRTKSAFTLIELLVVIVIIMILAGIAVPVIYRALEGSRRADCLRNMQEFGRAAVMSANDNNKWLPWGMGHPNDGVNSMRKGSLTEVAQRMSENGYITEGRVWVCPSDKLDDNDGYVKVAGLVTNTFDSTHNASYLYIVGLRMDSGAYNRMPMLADETNVKESGTPPPTLPVATDEDNHGANFRNVLMVNGSTIIGLKSGSLYQVVTNGAPATDLIWNSLYVAD